MQAEAGASTLTTQKKSRSGRTTRRGSVGVLIAVAVVGFALDQGTKWWALEALDPGEPKELIGSLLQLHLTFNPGAAFSIGTNATWVLTIIACAVIGFTIYSARKLRSVPWAIGLGLLIGGALGNLTDRFFREPSFGKGHVVDFLELPNWPIFNVADMCVVTAACLIALLSLRGIGLDGSRISDEDDDNAADDDNEPVAQKSQASDTTATPADDQTATETKPGENA